MVRSWVYFEGGATEISLWTGSGVRHRGAKDDAKELVQSTREIEWPLAMGKMDSGDKKRGSFSTSGV